MPRPHLHHLHPRSRMTSSLFATTLVASFFVVALPHVLPCPAPARAYADGEMAGERTSRSRRRRRVVEGEGESGGAGAGQAQGQGQPQAVVEDGGFVQFTPGKEKEEVEGRGDGSRAKARSKRECPVPKPGGVLGEWLGFGSRSGSGGGQGDVGRREER